MHKHVRKQKITGTGMTDKVAVLDMIERRGTVRAEVVPDRKRMTLQTRGRAWIERLHGCALQL
jgi:hypothetical protein